jgi:hypothetical protein
VASDQSASVQVQTLGATLGAPVTAFEGNLVVTHGCAATRPVSLLPMLLVVPLLGKRRNRRARSSG